MFKVTPKESLYNKADKRWPLSYRYLFNRNIFCIAVACQSCLIFDIFLTNHLGILSPKSLALFYVLGSVSYQQAVQDVKMMFPEGLCCTETLIMKHEQV